MVNLEPIKKLEERFTIEGEPLTFDRLMEVSRDDRLMVYREMGKANGRVRSPDLRTLERYEMVLGAYDSIGYEPISLRGVYYRVVSLYGVAKTVKVYEEIQRTVSDMRDYGILPFDYVLDGTRSLFRYSGYDGIEQFVKSISHSYKLNRWMDKEVKPLVMVEKRAMVDILASVCDDYGVDLFSASGFNSKTGWYNLVMGGSEQQRLDILVLTDYDTSGLLMLNGGREAIIQHGMIGRTRIKRIGLDVEDIERFNLETREDKGDLEMACELDAMTPEQARELLREHLNQYIDYREIAVIKEQEAREKDDLLSLFP